ncbi:MAG TPA: hypothetical protein VN420_04615 [Candidatus Fimivivens sp.]|nr:hypothetical protein [Candidatus Fimivivens sp.]
MSLQDLNEDVYRRDFEGGRDLHTRYDPIGAESGKQVTFDDGRWTAPPVAPPTRAELFFAFFKRHWGWFLAGFLFLAFLVFAANFMTLRSMLFSVDRFTVQMTGPTDIASAEPVSYTIHWSNDNILGAKGVGILCTVPDGFRPDATAGMTVSGKTIGFTVGDVKGHSSGDVMLSGKFYGSRNTLGYFQTVIRYSPDGLSGKYESRSRLGTTIVSSPLSIDVVAPQQAASGNETEYVVSYRNQGDVAFPDLRIRLAYPEGFVFSQSTPAPSTDKTEWKIGALAAGTGGEIRVKGTLAGDQGQSKTIAAEFGVLQGDGSFLTYDHRDQSTQIIALPLLISQTVNGKAELSVSPGEKLSYELVFVNNGTIGLRDVIITMDVNADLLDMSQLSLGGGKGAYDVQGKRIVWKAADIPSLARLEPRQSGTVQLTVPVRKNISSGSALVIRTVAKIDSPDVPFSNGVNKIIASNVLNVRIGAGARFETSVLYAGSTLPVSGPIPPRVGQETDYPVSLRVTNYLNDLSGAKVTVTIPTGVRYVGKKFPDSEPVEYNDRTGQLVWNIGTIQGGGASTRELILRLALVPGPNLAGKQPALIQDAVLDGRDTFTKNSVSIHSGILTTVAKEGSGIPSGGDTVVP